MFTDEKASELGAEIVCGSAQSFGNSPFYGGAQIGFIASKNKSHQTASWKSSRENH